jgi:hypothetical protein
MQYIQPPNSRCPPWHTKKNVCLTCDFGHSEEVLESSPADHELVVFLNNQRTCIWKKKLCKVVLFMYTFLWPISLPLFLCPDSNLHRFQLQYLGYLLFISYIVLDFHMFFSFWGLCWTFFIPYPETEPALGTWLGLHYIFTLIFYYLL